MLSEFKKFILKGNVIDLAVAVIIGGAFNQIVNSMVADVITPIIGIMGGSPDFSSIKLGPISIGKFINAVLNFIIVAAVIFFGIIKPMKKLQELSAKKEEKTATPQPATPEDVLLLREILDELKKR
ncbi:MAG: large conductance mechanosensitive channel protein MscL [Calditerrivibrio sp.]|nr:large conductance mechanosensitive channel protein MscL [Calditerrivibrio sp.]MCA1932295.1 large conductance mechanosensitive channel protein MscL [Calditerrivibrio sp.]MCA1981253.1 large conductance mechanosensitive channel protein MscL [Calditerrivibrio sp.]